MKTVRALSGVDDFATLVKEHLGHPVPLNVTRAQFHALPKAKRDTAKRTRYITPACYTQPTSPRRLEHATHCNLVALDVDNSTLAAPFVKDANLLIDALHPHPFAAYTTASSTTEAPRLRILVAADRIPAQDYPAAVRYVAGLLGMRTVTQESLVAVQPMYLPTLFRGEDPLLHHPLCAAVIDGGQPVRLEDLARSDGAPAVMTEPRGSVTNTPHVMDDLDFLRPPVVGVTLEDAKEALAALDPDMPMAPWIEVAAALKHQFNSEEAFQLWDEWSAKGKKYPKQEDLAYRWKTLRANTRGRVPVTIRTLFHRAANAGWSPRGTTQRCFQELMRWLAEPARTEAELLNEGVKRIAALPMATAVERGAALTRLRSVLSERKVQVTRTDLEKALRRLDRSAAKAATADADMKALPDKDLPAWARGLCYVAGANVFYHRPSDRQFSPEVLDRVYGAFLMGGADSDTGRPVVRPQDYLLNMARIPRVDHFRYDPRHPEQTFVREQEKRFVNLYLPSYPEPEADDADYAGEHFWGHLCNLIAEEDYRRLLVDFLAYMVQCPGEKIRWATLIQGAEGCGKTALAVAMQHVLGAGNVRLMDAALVFRQFNEWAMGAQLVSMEEIRIVGHNRFDVMNRLKPCITNDTISVEAKRENPVQVPNVTNYIMFTNFHDGLAVMRGDRRYFVLNSRIQEKDQVLDLGPGYFPKLFEVITNHAPGLRAWFEKWDFSLDFNPQGHAPMTTYLGELTDAVASPLAAAIQQLLEEGDHPLVRKDIVSLRALQGLLQSEGHPIGEMQLATPLRDMGFKQAGRFRLEDGKHRLWTRGVVPPDLRAECAQRMSEGVGTGDFAELL